MFSHALGCYTAHKRVSRWGPYPGNRLQEYSDFDPKKWAKIARYSKKFYSAGSLPAAQKFSFGPILNKKVFGGVWYGAQSCPK